MPAVLLAALIAAVSVLTIAGSAHTSGATPDVIAVAGTHACLLHDGQLWCWGRQPQDGRNPQTMFATINSTVPQLVAGVSRATSVALGAFHTCAIIDGGAVCWGDNTYGQLGDGTTTNSEAPVHVKGMESGVTSISAGSANTCAVKDAGLWCWGYIGPFDAARRMSAPTPIPGLEQSVTATSGDCVVKDGGVWCWTGALFQLPDGVTDTGPPKLVPGLASGVTALSNNGNICAIANARALCYGNNGFGQLGDGTYDTRRTAVSVVGLDRDVTAISVDSQNACAISGAAAYCWGANYRGQIGDGTVDQHARPVPVSGLASGVTAIGVGDGFACAIQNRHVLCWGDNSSGQLGNGTTTGSRVPIQVSNFAGGDASSRSIPRLAVAAALIALAIALAIGAIARRRRSANS